MSSNPNQDQNTKSLEKLLDWIDDGPHHFDQRPGVHHIFLFKSEFTNSILKEGMIHAATQFRTLADDLNKKKDIVGIQYENKIDFIACLTHFGIEEDPADLCLQEEIDDPNYAQLIADVDVESEPNFRRTVAAIARMLVKMRAANRELAMQVGREQGDID